MSTNNPTMIDVIMPIYNASEFLEEAIRSLQTQTFTQFRVIAIDDGSTDASVELYRSLTKDDARFQLIQQENAGVARTLNRALALCEAEFIARQDADDISAPTRFEKQLKHLQSNPKTLAVGSDYQKIIENKLGYIREVPITSEQIQLLMISRNCLPHGGMLIRASVFDKTKGYSEAPETKHVEDFDLWERVLKIGKIESIPEILYFHRSHSAAVSTHGIIEQAEKAELICKRIAYGIGKNPQRLLKVITYSAMQLTRNRLSPVRALFLKEHLKLAILKANKEKLTLLAFGLRLCTWTIHTNRED